MGLCADRQAGHSTAVSDHLRQLRKEEPDHHDKSRVFKMGLDLHRRPDGRGDDRPAGPPWAHPAVRGRELPNETRPLAAKALRIIPAIIMGKMDDFFGDFRLTKYIHTM